MWTVLPPPSLWWGTAAGFPHLYFLAGWWGLFPFPPPYSWVLWAVLFLPLAGHRILLPSFPRIPAQCCRAVSAQPHQLGWFCHGATEQSTGGRIASAGLPARAVQTQWAAVSPFSPRPWPDPPLFTCSPAPSTHVPHPVAAYAICSTYWPPYCSTYCSTYTPYWPSLVYDIFTVASLVAGPP